MHSSLIKKGHQGFLTLNILNSYGIAAFDETIGCMLLIRAPGSDDLESKHHRRVGFSNPNYVKNQNSEPADGASERVFFVQYVSSCFTLNNVFTFR